MKDKLIKSKQILTININMDGASASLYLYLDDSSTIYLSNLKVRKQYRRQGFGRKLLEMQEQIGISLNATTFCLWVQKGSWMHDWLIRRGYSDFNLHERKGFVWMIKNINQIEEEANKPYEPYFGWCDVDGCENEGSSGGVAWRETGYWTVCHKHFTDCHNGRPQPQMKQSAIDRENGRDKKTGYLQSYT